MGDESREIFRSDNVAIRSVPGVDSTRWVITFDHHSIGLGLDRPGFAEAILKEQGVSAIHVLGRGYDWYQYPDILEAASVVREATADAVRRVAYGSSMGGYAAVRFADAVGADAVLALSPQYSIDPSVVPWEQRWAEDGRRIVWLPELKGPLRCRCVPVLIFDPQGPDLRHAELITSDVPCTIIHAPYAGHPVTTYLGEVGLLRKVLLELLTDSHVPADTAAEIRRQRRRSSVYLGNLAEQQPSWRLTTGMEIARRAAAMGGGVSSGC